MINVSYEDKLDFVEKNIGMCLEYDGRESEDIFVVADPEVENSNSFVLVDNFRCLVQYTVSHDGELSLDKSCEYRDYIADIIERNNGSRAKVRYCIDAMLIIRKEYDSLKERMDAAKRGEKGKILTQLIKVQDQYKRYKSATAGSFATNIGESIKDM